MLNTPFSPWPSFTSEEAEAARDVILSNRVNYWTGQECREFEKEFAAWCGAKHAIALANGTLALDVALKALNIGPGDEVVVTPRTFIASISCVVNAGAIPVFAEVEPDSGNISARTVAKVLTPRTKGIICVHLAGWPCDMDPMMELAEKNGLKVIEDCAQAHGARYKGRSVGTIGHVGAWSFCQDKIMTTGGEGGMVTTNDRDLWSAMWSYKDHGKSWEAVYEHQHPPGFRWVHDSFGTNWRMLEVQAVIGRIQLRRMADWTKRRNANARALADVCAKYSALRVPEFRCGLECSTTCASESGCLHAQYKYYAYVRPEKLCDGWTRDRIVDEIFVQGVPCYQGSCSEVYLEKAFEGTAWRPTERFHVARELGETSLMFLVHPTLTDAEIFESLPSRGFGSETSFPWGRWSLFVLNVFLSLPRRQKQAIAVMVDFVLLILAFWSALALRFETLSPNLAGYAWQMVAAPLLAIPIFIRLGLYRAVIRFMEDRVVFVVAGGVSLSVVLLAAGVALTHTPGLSRGVLGIYLVLAILYVGVTRFLARSYFLRAERSQDLRKQIAIYGAGRAGTQLAYALRAGREYQPVAFFDDNPALQKNELAGLRVYPPEELASVISSKQVDELLLAIPSASRARRAEIIERLEGLHCKVKLVPGMADVVSGNVNVDAIREVEIEDLLGRESVAPNSALLGRCIAGKVVLVSGAGGSIGSELCCQIVRLKPKQLVLMELSEFALYSIEQELAALCARSNLQIELVPLLGSVTHLRRNEMVMKSFGVQTVYHAAAYKHVPLVEHNPIEGLRNNAVGTRRMAEAALAAGVETFVLISTDKAVRPTNVMGASKRLSELILQALARKGGATRFCMVRFGNVLGSSGSVVPLFRKQIAAGGPITLTHADITRYFMTIPEAAQLVIQAGSMGLGGEVYVLDMGKPVKIIDLARRMVHLSGLELRDEEHPNGDIAIEIVGLRPGEKLYEELLIGENVEGTSHPLIMRAYEHEVPWEVLTELLDSLDEACQAFDFERVLTLLGFLVREYAPVRHGDDELWWRTMVTPTKSDVLVH